MGNAHKAKRGGVARMQPLCGGIRGQAFRVSRIDSRHPCRSPCGSPSAFAFAILQTQSLRCIRATTAYAWSGRP